MVKNSIYLDLSILPRRNCVGDGSPDTASTASTGLVPQMLSNFVILLPFESGALVWFLSGSFWLGAAAGFASGVAFVSYILLFYVGDVMADVIPAHPVVRAQLDYIREHGITSGHLHYNQETGEVAVADL